MIALKPGDCGAWVIDKETLQVHGHVVASDRLGEGYVVPIYESFAHIKEQLGAISVELPRVGDILRWQVQRGVAKELSLADGISEPPDLVLFPHRPSTPEFTSYQETFHPIDEAAPFTDCRRPLFRPRSDGTIDSGYVTMNTTPQTSPGNSIGPHLGAVGMKRHLFDTSNTVDPNLKRYKSEAITPQRRESPLELFSPPFEFDMLGVFGAEIDGDSELVTEDQEFEDWV